MNTLTNRYASFLCLLALSAQLTGCFVAVPNDGSGGGDYYEDDFIYEEHHSDDLIVDESFEESLEEEIFEETIEEETFGETIEETIEEETIEETVADEGSSIVDSTLVPPPVPQIIFEETFESPRLEGIDRVSMNMMNQWAIDWAPGSRCERLSGTATIEVQSEVDVGDQFEVEGEQHVRLDGRCGQDLNPSRITTSIDDVSSATTLIFYARVAETAPHAELMIEWNDEIVMNEALLDVWAEYTIDLQQLENSESAILTLTALNPGVLIDHIRVE